MSRRQWALVVVLILVNYIVFSSLFNVVFSNRPGSARPTRTALPTFTVAPQPTPVALAPTETPPPPPTPTATQVLATPDTPTPESAPPPATEAPSTAAPTASGPSVTVDVNLNVRLGPGTTYDRIGSLAADSTVDIIGRSVDSSWWQIPYADAPDDKAWISAGYGTASNTDGVPVVEAPPTPTAAAPTATPTAQAPAASPTPAYQYTPSGWYGDTNYGLTRFLGQVKDTAGNPVDGVFVKAVCGTFSTISYPSGTVGWGPLAESADWPPGFYDITVDAKPVPCLWTLQVVATDDRETVKAALSEAVSVEVTMDQSVIQADWIKNW